MNPVAILEQYRSLRLSFFKWRSSSGIAINTTLAILFMFLTALCARISFPLPWTPVPVTGQTFAVLLAGAILGRWGAASQALYLGLGLAGLPWFASCSGGAPGPTAGYLAGFIIAPLVIGYAIDKHPPMREIKQLIILMAAADIIIIHGLGTAWLYIWLNFILHGNISIPMALSMGSIPFIAGDAIKALLAAVCAYLAVPKNL
jgi:biotin transport system substrate-specific component